MKFNKPGTRQTSDEEVADETRTTNYEGGESFNAATAEQGLAKLVINNLMEDKFYIDAEDSMEEIIEAFEEAADENPKFPVQLAAFAREEMNQRTVPQLLVTLAANHEDSSKYIPEYATDIMQRADEPAEVIAAHNALYGEEATRKLNNQLRKGMEKALNTFDAYEFSKYDKPGREIRPRDVINIVHPTDYDEEHDELFRKIAKGELDDYPEVDSLDTPRTWEVLVSQKVKDRIPEEWTPAKKQAENEADQRTFGWDDPEEGEWVIKRAEEISGLDYRKEVKAIKDEAKAEAYRELLNENKMGIFAKIRNLRNMLEVGLDPEEMLDDDDLEYVLSDRSQLYPFRFYQAYKAVKEGIDENHPELEEWLSEAVDGISSNLPEHLDGTVVGVDISGSMRSGIAKNSNLELTEIAELFGSVFKRNGADVYAFNDNLHPIEAHTNTPTFELMNKIPDAGGSTDGWKVIKDLKDNKKTDIERVVFITDEQLWNSNSRSYGYGSNETEKSFKEHWDEYKEMNPDASLFILDISSYGDMMMPEGYSDVYRISGWNSKIMEFVDYAENEQEFIEEIKNY